MTVFRVRGADHSNTWGFRRAHFCLSCCLTPSSAKMQSMARWERFHTDSRLRPKVEAASWYSWDKSVQKTPLSSVCNVIKRNISHATFFSCFFYMVIHTDSMWWDSIDLMMFTILWSTNVNICSAQREATYTNHTRMSQLVPVLEVMLGVTWHGLPFDIRCQTQL